MVRRRRDERHPRGRIAGLGDPGVHFFARKVAALTGLGPLRHLDLDLLRAAQVGAGHAEPPGGHLLDLAVPDRSESLRQFAALARIGAGTDRVHCDRQGLVRLCGQRAVAHRAGLEALYDLRGGFHFVDRDRVARRHELQEPAQRVRPLRVIHKVRVLPEFPIGVLPHRSLQRDDRLGAVHVVLFVVPAAQAVESHGVQCLVDAQSQRVKSVIVPERYTLFDLFDADAAHSAHGPGKIAIDDLFSQPDCFKDAGGLIGLEGRNAHFGRYFDHPGQQRAVIVFDSCVVVLVEHAQLDHLADALVRQVRIDRAHAEAEERRDLVDVPGLAALQDQRHGRALLRAYKVLLYAGDREQGGDGHMVLVHAPVREDDDVGPLGSCAVHCDVQLVQRPFQGSVLVVKQGDRLRAEARLVQIPDL